MKVVGQIQAGEWTRRAEWPEGSVTRQHARRSSSCSKHGEGGTCSLTILLCEMRASTTPVKIWENAGITNMTMSLPGSRPSGKIVWPTILATEAYSSIEYELRSPVNGRVPKHSKDLDRNGAEVRHKAPNRTALRMAWLAAEVKAKNGTTVKCDRRCKTKELKGNTVHS